MLQTYHIFGHSRTAGKVWPNYKGDQNYDDALKVFPRGLKRRSSKQLEAYVGGSCQTSDFQSVQLYKMICYSTLRN